MSVTFDWADLIFSGVWTSMITVMHSRRMEYVGPHKKRRESSEREMEACGSGRWGGGLSSRTGDKSS